MTEKNYTALQQERISTLGRVYSNERAELMGLHIEPRGENSWRLISKKVEAIVYADENLRAYNTALYEQFKEDTELSLTEIAEKVFQTRMELKMPLFWDNAKSLSLAELQKLFVVQPLYIENPSGKGRRRFAKVRLALSLQIYAD